MTLHGGWSSAEGFAPYWEAAFDLPPGWKMRFYDTQVHLLSPEVAYTVSLREEEIGGERSESRVTLIFLKKEGE